MSALPHDVPLPLASAPSSARSRPRHRSASSRSGRDYNAWVARETLEDYALRFTPQRFRRWSGFRVANTAFGARPPS